MASPEATAIHLAQEITLNTAGAREELVEHLNSEFLPGELRTLAQAGRNLAEIADEATGTTEL